MKLATKQLKEKLSRESPIRLYHTIDPQDTNKLINLIYKEKKIELYDLTFSINLEQSAIISVRDHINRTGDNPLILYREKLKIDFLDSTNIYQYNKDSIITDCCGEKLNDKYKFPSHYLSHISLIVKALKIKEYYAYLVNVL